MAILAEFLGRSRVSADGRELALSRQSVSFLAYLVLFRDIDLPREVIVEHFWASCEPERARSCLGTALSRLRKTLSAGGANWLQVSPRGEPRISASAPIWFDVVAFETAVAPALATPAGRLSGEVAAGLAAALQHYRGDLLIGWYDDWVLTERERLRVLCLRGYRRLMEHFIAAGEIDDALAAGLAAARIEPLQEQVQQRVIELYAQSGQRVEAIRHFDRFAKLLKSELAIAPSKSTRDLIERIRSE